MAVSARHAVAVTIRIDLGEDTALSTPLHSADLSLPAHSTLAECLPDIVELIGAPVITRPWQFRTAAGRELDPCVPLFELQLPPGSIVVLMPQRDTPAQVVKDAAESLLDVPTTFNSSGLAAAALAIGAVGIGYLAWRSNLPTLRPAFLLLMLAVASCGLTVWLKVLPPVVAGGKNDAASSGMAVLATWSFAAIGTFELVVQHRPTIPGDQLAWALLAALGTAAFLVVVCMVVANPPLLVSSALLVVSVLVGVGTLALFVFPNWLAMAATIIASGLVTLTWSAPLSIQLAGLSVPQLPSAGQDLRVSDRPILDSAAKAARASLLLDALVIGIGSSCAFATLWVGFVGGPFATCLCLAATSAVLLHAVRHRSPRAMWGLWLWALAGIGGAALTCRSPQAGVFSHCVVILCLLVSMSAPLWAGRVRTLPAPTLNWLEKCETLSIAAAIPIAVHLIGVFGLIRGLG
ncbi:type VII secretion integral membrane protein EccD [Staphylococcus chromogenes]|nr:type VII secretion integral membrane protein EccD [Staphylococcus chromogenes]